MLTNEVTIYIDTFKVKRNQRLREMEVMAVKMTIEELDVKKAHNEATRERYLAYKEKHGVSNAAFAVRAGFSRGTIQNWLARKFDFSHQSLEHIQHYLGCIHDKLEDINS